MGEVIHGRFPSPDPLDRRFTGPSEPSSAAISDASPMDVGQTPVSRSADRRSQGSDPYRRARFWAGIFAGISLVVGWWPLTIWFLFVATIAHRRRPK